MYNSITKPPTPSPQSYYFELNPANAHQTHRCLLYTDILVHALHTMLEAAPHRVVVPLLQYCLAGGMARFLRLPQFHWSAMVVAAFV